MSVHLVWVTPEAEQVVLQCARVSVPPDEASNNKGTGLLRYLIRNRHWSPFEMASMCVEVWTTRDIARQMIRHRTFSFQEFSQRYQDVSRIQDTPLLREARTQDTKNRQNSFVTQDETLLTEWRDTQQQVWDTAFAAYQKALASGVAKEQARALLPEGLTQSRLYMSGTLRSWIHYCQLRTNEEGTQKEHSAIAAQVRDLLYQVAPTIAKASFE